MIGFGNQAHLAHRARLLLGFPEVAQVTHRNLPLAQFGLPDTSQFKDQQVAPLRFMQVVGELGSSRELGWALTVGVHGRKKGGPGVMQLQEHLIGYLGGQRLVGLRLFEQVKRIASHHVV